MTVPLTTIAGFLGSGKTTLVNHLLQHNHGRRYAILVNDFGALNIDESLIRQHDGDTISFANGCLCCTMDDNFIVTIIQLLQRQDPPEHIIIEASGVADPRPISDVGELHPDLERGPILCLVDAATLLDRVADDRLTETLHHQIQSAHVIIVNKLDLLQEESLPQILDWLKAKAPKAKIVLTEQANYDFDSATVGTSSPGSAHNHNHATPFISCTVTFEGAITEAQLRNSLERLPSSVLRAKGFIHPTASIPHSLTVQMASGQIQITKSEHTTEKSVLVLIGTRDMPRADALAGYFNPTPVRITFRSD